MSGKEAGSTTAQAAALVSAAKKEMVAECVVLRVSTFAKVLTAVLQLGLWLSGAGIPDLLSKCSEESHCPRISLTISCLIAVPKLCQVPGDEPFSAVGIPSHRRDRVYCSSARAVDTCCVVA